MRRASRRVPIACALALIASPAAAADAPPTSALSWIRLPGAETCITASELGTRVERHLGRPVLVSPSVADVSIEGRVESTVPASARRFRAVVGGTTRDGRTIGAREIVSPGADCRALDDGLVLVVALMIDPEAIAHAQPAEPTAPSPTTITREIVDERVVVREIERPPPSRPWIVQATVAGVAEVERLPGAAPGARVAVRAGPTRVAAFELSLGVVPSAELDVGSRSVAYALFDAGLAFCPGLALGSRVEIAGCAGMRVGDVHSRGRDFPNAAEVDRGLADLAFGARAAVDVAGPVFAFAAANAMVPLVRQTTTATDADGRTVVLAEQSALGGELGAGVGLHFSP